MPLSRYTINNEFKSAALKLSISDKNDPYALLDGVAVAGMVGLIRQLGDLAQFAAEMFHDLHEEVVAAAARSHGLVDRIHQLEADVSPIENDLLSKAEHTEFYYNTGVDWHPLMSMNVNIITKRGMPRFIRESYEECRATPELFLLDKFDIGGVGTCLKRFTDPSFFSAQQATYEAGKLEAQKEKRTSKIKKKGSRLRNEDISEVLTASRAKLHQLLLEDRTGSGNDRKVPTQHVSLKKRNLDSSRRSKSYMLKFLQTMSPEHSAAHEVEFSQGLGSVAMDSIYSMDQETKPITPVKYSYDFNNRQRNKDFTTGLYSGNIDKELAVTNENRDGNGVICSSSDDISSATEHYMDAFAEMESEVEAVHGYRPMEANEYRRKKQLHVYSMSNQSSDFHSVDKSNTSDDGSVSCMQEISSSSIYGVSPYDKHWTAMEHGDREAEPFPSTETFEDRVTHSNQLLPAVDCTSNVGNYAAVSSDVNSISTFQEISGGFNHVVCNAQKTNGSYWADAAASAFLGLNVDYVGLLSTKIRDHAVTYSLSGYQDTEGHIGSNKLSRERNPADAMSEKGNSDNNDDHSPSRNGDSGQVPVSLSDHQEVGSQCSGSISPRYLVDPNSSCEMNIMDESRRPQGVSFKQYDQDMKSLDVNHGQGSEMLHPDIVIDSTSLRIMDWNSELTNHSPPRLDALSQKNFRQEWLLHPEEIPNEDSAADFPSLDQCLKQERGKVMFQSDSITNTFGARSIERKSDVSLPPPAPVQLMTGKPHDSFVDSGRESGEFIMDSDMSSPDVTCGRNITPLGGDITIKPLEAQTGESSSHTSIHNPGRFPFHADSMPLVEDKTDGHGQHSQLTLEEVKTNSSIVHTRTHLEVAQLDTYAFARVIQQPCSCLPTSVTDTDNFRMDSGFTTQFPVPLLGETAACTKETIQPSKPAENTILPVRKTTQPSIASKSSEPSFVDAVCEISAPLVPVHSTDQSPEVLKSHSKTELAARSPEEKIIKCIEAPTPRIMNEELCNQEIKSSELERSESCLLGLPNYKDENLVEKSAPAAKKLPRHGNPLIESVEVLDRSKLKKITPRNRLETLNVESVDAIDSSKSKKVTPNVDGRDSILQVIRPKSFNLKPTKPPVPKPIIRTPTMNLKVSAILDKANRIRQATAGSDEDDDWSD